MNRSLVRWTVFLLITFVVLGLDLWSKKWAADRFAAPYHPLYFSAGPGDGGRPVSELVARLFAGDPKDSTVLELGSPVEADSEAGVAGLGVLEAGRDLVLVDPPGTGTWYIENIAVDKNTRTRQDVEERIAALPRGMTLASYVSEHGGPALARSQQLVDQDRLYLYPRGGEALSPSKKAVEGSGMILVRNHLQVVPGLLRLVYVENPGAAWGFLASAPEVVRRTFLGGVSLLAAVLIIFFFKGLGAGRVLAGVSLAFVLGGAVGNFLDRLLRGSVVDFIDMYVKSSHWPTYNVADIAITVGAILLALEGLTARKRDPSKA